MCSMQREVDRIIDVNINTCMVCWITIIFFRYLSIHLPTELIYSFMMQNICTYIIYLYKKYHRYVRVCGSVCRSEYLYSPMRSRICWDVLGVPVPFCVFILYCLYNYHHPAPGTQGKSMKFVLCKDGVFLLHQKKWN